MIGLLGSHGYIGSAFAEECDRQRIEWTPVSYRELSTASLYDCNLVINCAAFIPKISVSLCDTFPSETIHGNLLLPFRLVGLCRKLNIPLAQISTGYLWNDNVEHGEDDPPQRAFQGYCGFYIGTKVLAEEEVRRWEQHYIWRLSLAFDERDSERNYLSKLARFDEVFDRDNCVSHRFDFVRACISMWQASAPFGTYNVMNSGSIRATRIIELLMQASIRTRAPHVTFGGHSDSKASIKKLLGIGIPMRSCEDAIADAINNWSSK